MLILARVQCKYTHLRLYNIQRNQGKAEVEVCDDNDDTETSARGNEHCVVVRDIQRLKVTTAFGIHKHSQFVFVSHFNSIKSGL